MTKKDKPNCYECQYRGAIPGDCHSCCKHPSFGKIAEDPMGQLLTILSSAKRIAPIQIEGTGITVKGNPHGIKKGWFNHPFNFDPVWLIECSGFKEKELKK
jgi:hypothetical protein